MSRPSKYPEEFRRDAVALVRASPERTVADVARELGVNHETLRQWVVAADRQQVREGAGAAAQGERRAEAREGDPAAFKRLPAMVHTTWPPGVLRRLDR